MPDALMELAASLGYGHDLSYGNGTDFVGPVGGNEANPTYVASACWALALLTEVYRNPMVMMRGPLERFQYHRPSASQLLDLTPAAAFGQLAAFREVFETAFLPELACRPGHWALGPAFSGSALIKADADLITAGLLLDLKADSKFSLGVTVLFQVIGYALLDFEDAYGLTDVGVFSARYAHFTTWGISELLDELVCTVTQDEDEGVIHGEHVRV